MKICVQETDSVEARVVNVPPDGPFLVLEFSSEWQCGDHHAMSLVLDLAEVRTLIDTLLRCVNVRPNDQPAEEPTAEDERGLNHD